MSLFQHLFNFGRRIFPLATGSQSISTKVTTRKYQHELLEPRQMLSADPIYVGVTYVEDDDQLLVGSDDEPDSFEITFVGGAPGTTLDRIVIDGDQDGNGFDAGDVFFDTVLDPNSFGKSGAHAPLIDVAASDDVGTVTFIVTDGSTRLEILFSDFQAGEKFVFTIDVDEADKYNPAETDINVTNSKFDSIASGVEFEETRLIAYVSSAHFFDVSNENSPAQFLDNYDFSGTGLENILPADSVHGENRTDGAWLPLQQDPLPITLSGTVFKDPNLNVIQDAGEVGLENVELTLQRLESSIYVDILTTTTDSQGDYLFSGSAVTPGTYRIVETQPATPLFSVGARAGHVGLDTRGSVLTTDIITDIILFGGENSVDNDFAEALPGSLSGFVFVDTNDNGIRDPGEVGIGGVTVELLENGTPTGRTLVTSSDPSTLGHYIFTDLLPGTYGVIEQQPTAYDDGKDQVGSAGGTALPQPGDRIFGAAIGSEEDAVNYNFGELIPPGSISGFVHSDPDGDCLFDQHEDPIAGVEIRLLDSNGNVVQTTFTNSNGAYRFDDIAPGSYSLVEVQPVGFFHSGQVVGSGTGSLAGADRINSIDIQSRVHLENYNFCETPHSSISGYAFVDANDNGIFDAGETPIADVDIHLLDASGHPTGMTTVTSSDPANLGFYIFDQGRPEGHTIARNGEHAQLRFISKEFGSSMQNMAVKFINSGPISGGQPSAVYSAVTNELVITIDDSTTANQIVELFDSVSGQIGIRELFEVSALGDGTGFVDITDSTTLHAAGLQPGVYGVFEVQPTQYDDGKDQVGDAGGVALPQTGDEITGANLTPGQHAVNYNFGELIPPGSISGFVHSDPDGDCEFDQHEDPIAGVTINLIDEATGLTIQTTTTDSDGHYSFDFVAPGIYSVREVQPAGFFHGGEVIGSGTGTVIGDDHLGNIVLSARDTFVEYNFCETPHAGFSGYAFVDENDNGVFDSGEQPIPGVTMYLLDASGQRTGPSVVTSSDPANLGFYEFTNLRPGTYGVEEIQPTAFDDGKDQVGDAGGVALPQPGDKITQIILAPDQHAENYNFGELTPPGSISGFVHSDPDGDCEFDEHEDPIEGVAIHLIDDATGLIVQSTTTDSNGRYSFDIVPPGTYSVVEDQPGGFFHGGETVGSGTGTVVGDDHLGGIEIGSRDVLVNYNFCETPHSTISGFVFQDGQTIITADGSVPTNLETIRDGSRTADDQPIAGVTLELRNAFGETIFGNSALPGVYDSSSPIQTVTNAQGFYQFTGLRAGNYSVYQVHPDQFIDGIDTEGTTGGRAVNPSSPLSTFELFQLAENPAFDAILRIVVSAGETSQENNFSEVLVDTEEVFFFFDPPELPPIIIPVAPFIPLETIDIPFSFLPPTFTPFRLQATGISGYTWHLSVVDAGHPRGEQLPNPEILQSVALRLDTMAFTTVKVNQSTWILNRDREAIRRKLLFGIPGAIPVSGDFNGDGISDLGIFYRGQWYLDVNGNGVWDQEDLWAKLGHDGDRPVVGDWDGDGKDDIGIFGPAWAGDPRAVAAEPGMPEENNAPTGATKNIPPTPQYAAIGVRTMKLKSTGKLRADLIDHVFHFGTATDVPIVGDWNGDGVNTIGIFRKGSWRLDTDGNGRWSQGDIASDFGQAGDVPVIGDWNGDGIDDLGVYRNGTWYLDTNGDHKLDAHDKVFQLGGDSDVPIVGDWDGDGVSEIGIYRDGVVEQNNQASLEGPDIN